MTSSYVFSGSTYNLKKLICYKPKLTFDYIGKVNIH